jgi:hypothetical protein
MALFPRCNNPVPVAGRHGITLVGCHSCIQCRVAAQEYLCKVLEVEASKHKYIEFFTLTYDFNILKTRSIFQYQVQKANMSYTENIKHRAVVDSYKN